MNADLKNSADLFPDKYRYFKLDNILSCFLILGVSQAFFSNIVWVNLPLVQIFALLFFLYLVLLFFKLTWGEALLILLSGSSFVFVLFSAAFLDLAIYQEFFYQAFACFLFLFFAFFFNRYDIVVSVVNGVPRFRFLLAMYLLSSLIVHFLFWEQVASFFYARDNDFGGLLMDGRVRRMYGLLFNPLSSAFAAFMFAIVLYLFDVKDNAVNFFLLVIVFFAFSRTATLLLFVFYLYVFSSSRPKLLLASFFLLLIFFPLFIMSPEGEAILDRALIDETGSISEHLRNYEIGFSHIFSILGEGFVDARQYGAWNIRLESMPLQFAFVGGGVVFFIFMALLVYCFAMLFAKFGFLKASTALLLIPLFFSFPLHTFNLPILLLAFILCAWVPSSRYV